MRNISVLFRILLPPMFLVRFCLPRPPELVSGDETHTEQRYGDKFHVEKYENQTELSTLPDNNNDGSGVLDAEDFEQIQQSGHLLKEKGFVKRLLAFNDITNDTYNFDTKSGNISNSRKDMTLYRTNNRAFGNLFKSDQYRRTKLPKYKQANPQFLLQLVQSLSLGTTKHKTYITSNNALKRFRELHISLPGPVHNQYSQIDTDLYRTKRDVNETLESAISEDSFSRRTPPEYMVRLFQLLSGTHYETLRNFVVTGFVNLNKNEDFTQTSSDVTTRRHRLLFDVAIPYDTEIVHFAELRLYFVQSDHEMTEKYKGESIDNRGYAYHIQISEKNRLSEMDNRLLADKIVVDIDDTWVSFNLTLAVHSWTSHNLRDLEVTITCLENCTTAAANQSCQHISNACITDFDINLNNDQGKGPLLVIFSRKLESPLDMPHHREIRDTTEDVEGLHVDNENHQPRNKTDEYGGSNASSGFHYFQGLLEFISVTSNYSSNNLLNSESALLNDVLTSSSAVYEQNNTDKDNNQVQEINDNSTFLNNQYYQQSTNNNSRKYQTFQEEDERTKSEVRNDQKHTTFLQDHRMTSVFPEKDATFKLSEEMVRMRLRRETKIRYRRHLDGLFKREAHVSVRRQKRSKKKRLSCQRSELYVDFETIKYDMVIIFPRGYQAFECVGKCYTPISEFLTPTKHAIIQTLIHTSYPEKASRACCVPTKLEPISILYFGDNGDIKYDYTYEGMVVAECGCR